MKRGSFLLLVGTLFAVPAAAQEDRRPSPDFDGEAIIYRDTNYQGPAMNVSRPNPNLSLAWPVRSIRIVSGRWELCTLTNYRGSCTTIDRDTPDLRRQINFLNLLGSMRPLPGGGRPPRPEPPRPEPPIAPVPDHSLRGMAAEFFPAPSERGRRVQACDKGPPDASCTQRTARNFCQDRGYVGVGHQALETVGRQVYLADTLCTRTR